MNTSLAIVAYRCEVSGTPTESIDIQVRFFTTISEKEITSFLEAEPTQSYENMYGELVTWLFIKVLAIESLENPQNGQEVIDFITGCNEFAKWATKSAT